MSKFDGKLSKNNTSPDFWYRVIKKVHALVLSLSSIDVTSIIFQSTLATTIFFSLNYRDLSWNISRFIIVIYKYSHCTKNNIPLKDFFSKRDHIRRKMWIWSYLLKKSLMENFIFCAVLVSSCIALLTVALSDNNF